MSQQSQDAYLPIVGSNPRPSTNIRRADSQYNDQLISSSPDKQFIEATKNANRIIDQHLQQQQQQYHDNQEQQHQEEEKALDSQQQQLYDRLPFATKPQQHIVQDVSQVIKPYSFVYPSHAKLGVQPLTIINNNNAIKPLKQPSQRDLLTTVTKNGHLIFDAENSVLYTGGNPAPSVNVLNQMLEGTHLNDSEGRIYYKATDFWFNKDWITTKKQAMTFDTKNDEIYWVRDAKYVNKGIYVNPFPQVGTNILLTNMSTRDTLIYKVVENSDGKIDRKPGTRNTGWIILKNKI